MPLGLIGFVFTVLMVFFAAGCATQPRPFPIAEAGPGILVGRKPSRQGHFEALHARGVRTILSLEDWPWDIWPELWKARRDGLQYRDIPILAAPLPPSEKGVKQALLILDDRSLRPIFVHCFLGEDRSAFIIGLYHIYFQDWTPQAAWDEMLRSGFHSCFRLRGLSAYFWRHTQKPAWVKQAQDKPP